MVSFKLFLKMSFFSFLKASRRLKAKKENFGLRSGNTFLIWTIVIQSKNKVFLTKWLERIFNNWFYFLVFWCFSFFQKIPHQPAAGRIKIKRPAGGRWEKLKKIKLFSNFFENIFLKSFFVKEPLVINVFFRAILQGNVFPLYWKYRDWFFTGNSQKEFWGLYWKTLTFWKLHLTSKCALTF